MLMPDPSLKPPVNTGEKTISGRTIWNDPETGKDYSERSTTFEIDGKYYTMPTVSEDGIQYTDDQIRTYVKQNGPIDYLTGEELPEFRNRKDAIEYAISRSSTRKKPKAGMAEGGSVEEQTATKPTKNFNEGGAVPMKNQMRMFAEGGLSEEGGIADDGMSRDPVSGNEIPPGSLASEVRDDVPAQLSEGEYVVPADVVRFFGVRFFEDLRMTAKQGLQQMEQDGRIGGEPVESNEDQTSEDLSPDEQALLERVMSMEQAPQPEGMAEGGVIKAAYGVSVAPGSGLTEDIPIYTGNPIDTTSTSTPAEDDGISKVFYIHPDGRRIEVLTLDGDPIEDVPKDFDTFFTDTPQNRILINFKVKKAVNKNSVDSTDNVQTSVASSADTDTDYPYGSIDEQGNEDYYQQGGETEATITVQDLIDGTDTGKRQYKSIGINGVDPLAGAKAALATGSKYNLDFVQGIGNAKVLAFGAAMNTRIQTLALSRAYANGLHAEDMAKNGPEETRTKFAEMSKAINEQIEEYTKKTSSPLSDFTVALGKIFVKPGLNRFKRFKAAGGTNSKSSPTYKPIEAEKFDNDKDSIFYKVSKEERKRIEKNDKENREKEEKRLQADAVESGRRARTLRRATKAEAEAVRKAGGHSSGPINEPGSYGGAGSVTNASGQGVSPSGDQGTGYGGQSSSAGQMTTPSYTPSNNNLIQKQKTNKLLKAAAKAGAGTENIAQNKLNTVVSQARSMNLKSKLANKQPLTPQEQTAYNKAIGSGLSWMFQD